MPLITHKPLRIEICAGLGCGKTTLAKALQAHGLIPVHENFDQNPHLEKFYAAPNADNAYQKDLWFIHDQSRQLESLQDKAGPFVIDYSCVLSQAYIQAGLNSVENKKKLLQKWGEAIETFGWPDVVIVLNLPVDLQMQRIQARGRASEKDLPVEFLNGLNAAIDARLQTLPETIKVIRIDARRDFTDNAEISKIYQEILTVIRSGRSRKNSYLNFK